MYIYREMKKSNGVPFIQIKFTRMRYKRKKIIIFIILVLPEKDSQACIPLFLWLPSLPWPVWSMLSAVTTLPARLMRKSAHFHNIVLPVPQL
jgi:hypothetical protein